MCAGDFVDRGAWGLETLAVLAAWKLAAPGAVTLLRGNHESATCTAMYGFRAELVAKYGAVRTSRREFRERVVRVYTCTAMYAFRAVLAAMCGAVDALPMHPKEIDLLIICCTLTLQMHCCMVMARTCVAI